MNKIRTSIKTILAFLLPILGRATLQVAADELHRFAYPDRKRVRVTQKGTDYSTFVDRNEQYDRVMNNPSRYHDVLMVAFDLTGKDPEDVQAWLMDQMPEAGLQGDSGEIYLDSWWIANDERFDRSDCDSAVFVAKGRQVEARELLHSHGLSDEVIQREGM
jgi:hypothetical protein